MSEEVDTREYSVVVNHEEQYSIWLAARELPEGWSVVAVPAEWKDQQDSGKTSRELCLDYIEEVWTDMRPLSLRKAMAEN